MHPFRYLTEPEGVQAHGLCKRTYDRIPVVRYNKDYMLPALYESGKTYAGRLENGFDMYY